MDLSALSGLSVELLDGGTLRWGAGITADSVENIGVDQLMPVLADPAGAAEWPGGTPVVRLYRGVAALEQQAVLQAAGLRYDLITLAPGTLGRERVKTHGAYHSPARGASLSYPAVYESLQGWAHLLLHKLDPAEPGRVVDAVLVALKPGQKALVPPDYGHVLINAGPDRLVAARLIAADCRELLERLAQTRGGAYYELLEGRRPVFAPNPAFGAVPELRMLPVIPNYELALVDDVPLYRAATEDPLDYQYLTDPSRFQALLRAAVEFDG